MKLSRKEKKPIHPFLLQFLSHLCHLPSETFLHHHHPKGPKGQVVIHLPNPVVSFNFIQWKETYLTSIISQPSTITPNVSTIACTCQLIWKRSKCTLCAIKFFEDRAREKNKELNYHTAVHRTTKMCDYCQVYLCHSCFTAFHDSGWRLAFLLCCLFDPVWTVWTHFDKINPNIVIWFWCLFFVVTFLPHTSCNHHC